MKKRSLVAFFACVAALTLTGCQNHQQSASTKQSRTSSVKKHKTRTFGHNGNTNSSTWDSTKQEKLDDFFDDWADTMKQEYTEYDGDGQMKTSAGEEFPKDFNNVYLNDQKISLAYEPDGEGNAEYNVVAMYNHNNPKGPSECHITYFFAFHDGDPIVLCDQTTNGGKVMVEETQNKDLRNGFAAIAAGKNASMNDSDNDDDDSASAETEDPKLIGVFIGLYKSPKWFKDNLKNGRMYFSDDAGDDKTKGFDCITANGDPASYFWYKQDGDDIVFKYIDPDHYVSDGIYKTEHISLTRLKNDYYVNSSQKQEVNGYVNRLKSLDDAD